MSAGTWCFCVPYRVASLGIGALYLIVNLFSIVGGLVFLGIRLSNMPGDDKEKAEIDQDHISANALVAYVLGPCAVCILNSLACVLLIYGALRQRWEFVLCWVAWYAIFLGFLTIGWAAGVIHLVNIVVPSTQPPADVEFSWDILVPLLPIGIIVLICVWYWYACVVAYYRALKSGEVENDNKVVRYKPVRNPSVTVT